MSVAVLANVPAYKTHENKKGHLYRKPSLFFHHFELLNFTVIHREIERPQGDSNPRRRRERAVSWAGLDDGDKK